MANDEEGRRSLRLEKGQGAAANTDSDYSAGQMNKQSGNTSMIMALHRRVMRALYNLTLVAVTPALGLYVAYRWLRRKPLDGWSERMGYLPEPKGQPAVWVHAVSAGEAVAAEAVMRALRARVPEAHLVYTAGTPEGWSTARKRMADLADTVAYVPYDFSWAVARALDRVKPRLLVLVEAELWPNMIQAAADRGIPVMLANGYVSETTYRRGRSVPCSFLHRWIFANIRSLCVQSEAVRKRAVALGAVPARVSVTGSVKYDQATAPLSPEKVAEWRDLLRLSPDDPVLVAGSTHPGEERYVLDAYKRLLADGISARLILAPRHPYRAEEVEALVRAAGLPLVRRSRLQPGGEMAPGPEDVILLDTMGELAGVFSLATVVFLGGSLVPVGGHDILQPLIAGKPVILGPHTHRQREMVGEALSAGVVWEVANADELAQRTRELLQDPETRTGHALRAVEFVASRRGASDRCAAEAARLLRETDPDTHRVPKRAGRAG